MFTKIDALFWIDDKIRMMTPAARYLMLYLLSCPHRNMLGCYLLPKLYAKADTRLTDKEFNDAWQEVEESGMIEYDYSNEMVYIENFLRYHTLDNQNQVKAAIQKVKEQPPTILLLRLAENIAKTDNRAMTKELVRALKERVAQRVTVRVTETHTETVTVTRKKKEEEVKGDVDVEVKETIRPPKPDYESEFETLWKLYPAERRQGKQKAKDKYIRARKAGTTFADVKSGLERYVAHIATTHTEPRYIKQAETWFNGSCWQDEYNDTGGNQNGNGRARGTSIHRGATPEGMFISDESAD